MTERRCIEDCGRIAHYQGGGRCTQCWNGRRSRADVVALYRRPDLAELVTTLLDRRRTRGGGYVAIHES